MPAETAVPLLVFFALACGLSWAVWGYATQTRRMALGLSRLVVDVKFARAHRLGEAAGVAALRLHWLSCSTVALSLFSCSPLLIKATLVLLYGRAHV
jgi:hypothetical protein